MSVPLPDSVSPIKCLVIGASFEGLIVAYLLQQAGHQVVVVDKGDTDRQVRVFPHAHPLLRRLFGDWRAINTHNSQCAGF